jgi:anti-sigma regulatory factor (Ser/Thr protein kinase)
VLPKPRHACFKIVESEQSHQVDRSTIVVERLDERSFSALTESIAPARRYVRQAAAAMMIDQALLSDVELAASELISNAIEHGCGSDFGVNVAIDDGHFVLEVVSDHCGPDVADPAGWNAAPVDALTGRGLNLVRAVSSSAWAELVNGTLTIGCRFIPR